MRFVSSIIAFGALAFGAAPGIAQSPAAVPLHQVNFDVSFAGLNVGYAVRNSDRTSFGASIGVGGNWMNYMAVAGRHFAESNGLSYETKDGSTGKEIFELARAGVFVRRHFDGGRQIDLGLKASGFLHFDSSDDDPGGGTFVGADLTGMWWQWRRLRLGSELDLGMYSESGDHEFGINVAPLLLRVSIP